MEQDKAPSMGRAIVAAVISSYFTCTLLLIIVDATRLDTVSQIVGCVVQNVIMAALFYAVWIGHNWGRWTIAAMCVLGAIVALALAFQSMTWKFALLPLYFFSLAGALLAPDSVKAFIEDQRRNRSEQNQPAPAQRP